jgi:hypothetical protein
MRPRVRRTRELPARKHNISEMNQVFLDLLAKVAHAIQPSEKGVKSYKT